MAYTSSPEIQSYETKDVPVGISLNFRPGFYNTTPATRMDGGALNMVPREVSGVGVLESRPGFDLSSTVIASGLSNPQIRGAYLWEQSTGTGVHFIVIDQTVFFSQNNGGLWGTPITLPTAANTPVGFTEYIDASNNKSLILVDGYNGYKLTYTPGSPGVLTVTTITDVDFPSPHLPFPIFIDGYLFLAKANTGDIYNSDLNDPTSWTPGNFISMEVYPDNVQALAKIDNYLLAIGTTGSEYFYDIGNSVGSPLARYSGGILPFGTMLPYTMATNRNELIMVANRGDGESFLVHIEGFNFADITPPWLISVVEGSRSAQSSTVNSCKLRGQFVRLRGQEYYTIRLPNSTPGIDFGYFVYHIKSKFWSEWTGGSYAFFPVYAFAPAIMNSSLCVAVGLDSTRTICYMGLADTVNDIGYDRFGTTQIPFPVEWRSDSLDFDTLNRKVMARVGVLIDNMAGGATTTNIVVYTNDDDNAWNNTGTVTATGTNNFPFLYQLGQFRQRRLKLTTSGSTGVRLKKVEVKINKGWS